MSFPPTPISFEARFLVNDHGARQFDKLGPLDWIAPFLQRGVHPCVKSGVLEHCVQRESFGVRVKHRVQYQSLGVQTLDQFLGQ